MATHPAPLSSHALKNANGLTRLSAEPGNLDYNAYKQYLTNLGHVRPNHNTAFNTSPMYPMNSMLQDLTRQSGDNMTDFRADQAYWSQDNLPEMIYAFDKPRGILDKHHLKEPPMKTYPVFGKILRDVPILPDHVASKVEGWRVEAWMRFDPRVSLQDIMDRMDPANRVSVKSVIQMRTLRFRDDCKVLGWVALGKNYDLRKIELRSELLARGISLTSNSTRGLSWGLIDRMLGEAGGRIVIPENRRVPDTVDMNGINLPAPPVPVTTTIPTPAASTAPSPNLSIDPSGSSWYRYAYEQEDSDKDIKEEQDEEKDGLNMLARFTAQLPTPTSSHTVSPASSRTVTPGSAARHNQTYINQAIPLRPFTAAHAAAPTVLPPFTPANQIHAPTQIQSHTLTPDTPAARLPPQPQYTVPAPPPEATTTIYNSSLLTLKTAKERREHAATTRALVSQWHPYGSQGRRDQLSYILDPVKLAAGNGFIDQRGYWAPVVRGVTAYGEVAGWECIDADIVYY